VTLRAVPPEPELTPAEPSALARVTGDPFGFLSETWSQRAAVFPDADGGGFADLLSLEDVDRLLTTTSPRTPTFRLVKAGAQIPESTYTRSGRTGSKPVSGMADPARIFALFDDGATIVLQGVHRYHEPVARFCRALELELGHPCQANAYITPAGAQGLALHADPHDVFVLQAFGRKQWEVHGAPAESKRDPLEATVDPGDAIYMPKGTPHAASAQATASGHLTIGVHVTTWREVLDGAWREVEEDPAFDEPVAAGWHRDLDAFSDEFRDRLAAASSALASVDTDAQADRRERRFLSSRAQLMHGALRAQLGLDAIDDTTLLRRRDGAVCEIRPRGDRLEILLGDRALEMPGWLEPGLRHIAASDRFRPRDLAPEIGDPASRLVLTRRLVREGLLVPDDLGVR
jgi:bifunctional lysine-specific demethylase and histidyl-hydroxylase NO66